MAAPEIYSALALQMVTIGAVRRGIRRTSPMDCPPSGLGVLAALNTVGPLRLGELSELLSADLSVTSRHVSYLVKHGLLSRQADPDDRRSRLLTTTEAGRAELCRATEHWTDTLAGYLRDWPDEDVSRLTELLARLRESFDTAVAANAHHQTNPEQGTA
jgi:DNA-binding MarR family transcriptional regulator